MALLCSEKNSFVENLMSVCESLAEWLRVLGKLPKAWLSWTVDADESLFSRQRISPNFYTIAKQLEFSFKI